MYLGQARSVARPALQVQCPEGLTRFLNVCIDTDYVTTQLKSLLPIAIVVGVVFAALRALTPRGGRGGKTVEVKK